MDAIPLFSHILANNPLRTPDWRCRRAQDLVAGRRRLSSQRDDTQTIELARYLRDVHVANRYFSTRSIASAGRR